jgi:hypothetical protein
MSYQYKYLKYKNKYLNFKNQIGGAIKINEEGPVKNIINYSNGDKYEGNIENGEKNGYGKMEYSNGNVYIGNWKDDKKEGNGRMNAKTGTIYEGNWLNDKRNGYGKIKYYNNDIYEGEWLNSKRHGLGKMIYLNDTIYFGNWQDDKKHGEGTITINGKEYKSVWDNDISIKDKSIKSVSIKNQKENQTCWAHAYSRTFIRTLQILDVIKSDYIEEFYILFYTILLNNKNNDCIQTGNFNDMLYLFNYLKNNYQEEIFKISKNKVSCFDEICIIDDNPILNIPIEIKQQIIEDLKYLFDNNLLYLSEYIYNLDLSENASNTPTKAIETMLKLKLQPVVYMNMSQYLSENLGYTNLLIPKDTNVENILNSNEPNIKCINDNMGHFINLRKWSLDGIEFKNSYGINSQNNGNFLVSDLKYLICKEANNNINNTYIIFNVLMFDINKINQTDNIFRTRLLEKFDRYWPTINNTLQIKDDDINNVYDVYGFLSGKCKIIQDNNEYNGYFKNGLKNGLGEMRFKNGDIYNGEWKNGIIEGIGEMRFENGDIYKGKWENRIIEGIGEMRFENGDIYNGEWKNNLLDGKGEMRFENGDIYKGEWKNGIIEGIGEMRFENGDIYNGEWKNNLLDGKGEMKYDYGNVYKGIWVNGNQEGPGITIYKDGTIREELWKNGKNILRKY